MHKQKVTKLGSRKLHFLKLTKVGSIFGREASGKYQAKINPSNPSPLPEILYYLY